MTDQLDTLRSFRPEAAGPTAALTQEGRNTLMTAIDAERLPRPVRRRRRFVRVAVVCAAALVAVGGVAAATGLIPDDVRQSLGLVSGVDPALAPNADQAVQRASVASPDGGTVELWTAPTSGDGSCAYLRHLDASGTPTDQRSVTCDATFDNGRRGFGFSQSRASRSGGSAMFGGGPDGPLSVQVEWASGEPLALYGKAPQDATEVDVTHADGTVTTTPVTDGWWLAVFGDGTDPSSLTQIEARSPSGTSLGVVPIHAAAPPPGSGGAGQSVGG
jgi:hypothetical protein